MVRAAVLGGNFLLALAGSAFAAQAALAGDLADMSLEDLMKIEVTSASRKAQPLLDTAAAVFVITGEDVARSGATSIPEALRMAPGVQVAKISNNRWAVSARGFNGRFANKLQVLIDGRSIYEPLFGGVLWENSDTLLEDVDRIEVIRGPGAAMWGANAVNGVINIITKKARDTVGALVSAGAGSQERTFGAARYGARVGEDSFLRGYVKGFDRNHSVDLSGSAGNDVWRGSSAGFRFDHALSARERLTVTGEAHANRAGDEWNIFSPAPLANVPTRFTQSSSGTSLLARYENTLDSGSEVTFQGFIDYSDVQYGAVLEQRRQTLDLDFQQRLKPGGRHDVIWGVAYRVSPDTIASSRSLQITPENDTQRLASVFVHDEMTLVPRKLYLMMGAKLEHNNLTGLEPQPSVRLLWTPDATHSVWGAASRAARIPTRSERNLTTNGVIAPGTGFSPALVLGVRGGGELAAERLDALEAGYRAQLSQRFSIDIAAFVNRYRNLVSSTAAATALVPGPQPYLLLPVIIDNSLRGVTRGMEMAIDWRPRDWWRIQASYTYFDTSIENSPNFGAGNFVQLYSEGNPRNQLSLRPMFDLPSRQRFDFWLRYVDRLGYGAVPSHVTLDVSYAWRLRKDLEIALVGQNLLDDRHPEFRSNFVSAPVLQVQRAAYVKIKWQY